MITQIFHFHPGFVRSRTNAAMLDAAQAVDGVKIHRVCETYPDAIIDVDTEIALLMAADRIVFQFPVHWYSTPSLMKEWQDQVLTLMFYIQPDLGAELEGKPVLVVATAGNVPSAYSAGGINLFPLTELLRPLQATANRCGLVWTAPFLVFKADRLSDVEREATCAKYANRLRNWSRGEKQRSLPRLFA